LFNPRQQNWSEHFEWKGMIILGMTAVGRTTVSVLQLNSHDRIEVREEEAAS
jgi:hypothetical protein